jgi:Spy/CpxP family protein refolding chaperone
MAGPRDFESRLAQNLGLNAEQQNKVHTVMAESRLSMQGLREQRQTLDAQLTAAIKSGDESQIENVTQQMGNLHQQETAIHAKTTAKVYASLSADQKAKVGPNLEVLRGGPMGGRRPGPPPARPNQIQ